MTTSSWRWPDVRHFRPRVIGGAAGVVVDLEPYRRARRAAAFLRGVMADADFGPS